MTAPTRAALAERLRECAQVFDVCRAHRPLNPEALADAGDWLGNAATEAAAALLREPEASETNTLADRLNAASYDIEQHAPASEYATRAQVALADLRLWLTTEGAYPQVALSDNVTDRIALTRAESIANAARVYVTEQEAWIHCGALDEQGDRPFKERQFAAYAALVAACEGQP